MFKTPQNEYEKIWKLTQIGRLILKWKIIVVTNYKIMLIHNLSIEFRLKRQQYNVEQRGCGALLASNRHQIQYTFSATTCTSPIPFHGERFG